MDGAELKAALLNADSEDAKTLIVSWRAEELSGDAPGPDYLAALAEQKAPVMTALREVLGETLLKVEDFEFLPFTSFTATAAGWRRLVAKDFFSRWNGVDFAIATDSPMLTAH